MVPQYDRQWCYAATVEPTKGEKGAGGAPLVTWHEGSFPLAADGGKKVIPFSAQAKQSIGDV